MPKVKTTINFEALIRAYYDPNISGVVLEGGSRSGKTHAVGHFFAHVMRAEQDKVFTTGRDTLVNAKLTYIPTFKKAFGELNLPTNFGKLNPEVTYNRNLLRCVGYNDDIMKTHGLEQHIFYANEAISLSKDTFDQLEQRTETFWVIDQNPMMGESWTYNLALRDDVFLFKSNYKDNPFAPEKAVKKIESYCPWLIEDLHLPEDERRPNVFNIQNGTADLFKWKVYGEGVKSASEEIIFQNWETVEALPEQYDFKIYGLDFGYTNDPTGCLELRFSGNNLFIKQHLYDTHLTNGDIAHKLAHLDKNTYIVADNAEPKSITELITMGLNVIPCNKGKDSINFGINKIKQKRLYVCADSPNAMKELNHYRWVKDRKTGKILNIPIDNHNHLMDAMRYAATKFMAA